MKFEKISEKFLRLGNVIYWLSIIISILIAGGIFFDSLGYESGWISYVHPTPYLWLGVTLLLSFFAIELIRRILRYISNGESIFKKEFHFGTKTYLFIILVPFIFSFGLFLAQSKIEKIYYRGLAHQNMVTLEKFLDKYTTNLSDARACSAKSKEQKYQQLKPYCESQYRQSKLNYDSCREFSSRTFCLSLYDYESIDCSEEALVKDNFDSSCLFFDIDSKKPLYDYLKYSSYLTMDERMGVMHKISSVIESNKDSMLVKEVLDSINLGYFKEEIEINKNSKK